MAHSDTAPGLVSVIMPSFNHETFVAEAMQSVFNQSHREVELLILDDCSSDSTFKVINEIAKDRQFVRRFRRLEIARNERNLGAHETLNRGIAASRGAFVTFINSDDGYEPERLRMLTSRCEQMDKPFLAFSAVRLIDGAGHRVRRHELKDILEQAPDRFKDSLPSLSFGFLRYQLTGSTGNIFVNRSLANEVGGFAELKYCHDWDFMLRAITVAEPCYVPQTAYRYRLHGANTFGSLQHFAMSETEKVLGKYYRRIARSPIKNHLVPTPTNWPYVFEMISKQFGVYDAWLSEAAYMPRYASRQSYLKGEVVEPLD